ncbi:unnamed protein product [Penicillium glandicola]
MDLEIIDQSFKQHHTHTLSLIYSDSFAMAPIIKTLALAGAFFALTGYSAPVDKRAVVWETVTDVVWVTVDVTTTIYPQAQATHTATVVPVVANAVPTVEAATKKQEKAATTTSSTTTSSTTTTTTTSSSTTSFTTTAAPTTAAPTVEVEAPVPTVEAKVASTTSVATTSTTTASATTTRSADTETTSSSSNTGVCSESAPCDGDITYYDTATTTTNPSSCGTTNDGTVENVLALPHGIMVDSDCGKTVTITYNGQTATGIVVDKCMGCDNSSVDLSRHFFGELAPMDKGRVSGAKWYIH